MDFIQHLKGLNMINIIIDCKDQLYRQGIELMIANILHLTSSKKLTFSSKLDSAAIEKADILVKYFSAGEEYICQPVFLERKKQSLVIGLYDGGDEHFAYLPQCIEDIVFINCNKPLNEVVDLIQNGWQRCQTETHSPRVVNCQNCRHRTLSAQQIKVASYIHAGIDVRLIAEHLNITPKTVCAHKRMIMMKFNLKNDKELITLLSIIKQNETSQHLNYSADRRIYG
jgi:DNA-binding CsgD family transcriptional regulator